VICGFGGALYVWVHRRYVFFMRSNKVLNKFLQKNRFIYPGILAFMVRQGWRKFKRLNSQSRFRSQVATISYPNGAGKFIAGELSTHEQVCLDFFIPSQAFSFSYFRCQTFSPISLGLKKTWTLSKRRSFHIGGIHTRTMCSPIWFAICFTRFSSPS
jgi:hypothetical protein